MKIAIEQTYDWHGYGVVDLPEGKTEKDIKYVDVKWGTAYVVFNDGTRIEAELPSLGSDQVDWRRPKKVTVFHTDDEGDPDWARVIIR